jgi:hypothetical protein
MSLGNSANIVVGAAKVFISKAAEPTVPTPVSTASYVDTVVAASSTWTDIGYTNNGLEIQFQPEFGEVRVDQILDVAKMFKSGMQVTLNTSMAEATLENLLLAIAGNEDDLNTAGTDTTWGDDASAVLSLNGGSLGQCPVERGLIAVGPSTGDCITAANSGAERVYLAYRVLSIDSVTLSAKRDEASTFDVSFRLLPNDSGVYGQIVDREWAPTAGTT